MFIREMRLDDLSFVMRVQRCCYHAIVPESQAVMESKLTIGPGCCFVCEENNFKFSCFFELLPRIERSS